MGEFAGDTVGGNADSTACEGSRQSEGVAMPANGSAVARSEPGLTMT